ncbi:type I-E CRISPR-associated protein Cas7/Cse4/CasC [Streptomyces sodiiphilus]|uniref:Type I-E CRISPR-associated protein Cas7/Cse4/CasC n=1 Tax=Streptomyces sodiiphilus TaxID=226217 RepID=A0ABN2PKS7_9ACTN
MSRTILDLHVIQTVPPSNINRDDTGAPKTAVYGGVRRSRVSSQAWKRATREAFTELLEPAELGVRTRKVAELVADSIQQQDDTVERAEAVKLAAETVQIATGSKIEVPKRKAKSAKDADATDTDAEQAAPESSYLMFLSSRQRDGLAELALRGREDIKAFFKSKENKAEAKQIANTRHSVDIALFGRMVADAADINVDASTQVAHAISVHAAETEADYYTAVDDRNTDEESGAGMIGTVEFNSATLYRYAALNVDQLAKNLGPGIRDDDPAADPVRRAVEAFVRGFISSMPTGKVNTFGNHTLPDAVVVKLRSDRPISFVGAFEQPTKGDSGHVREACEKLAKYIPDVESTYDAAEGTETWVMRVGDATADLAGLGTEVTLSELVTAVGRAVQQRREQGA